MSFFDRYLTPWVALCMSVGVALGKAAPSAVAITLFGPESGAALGLLGPQPHAAADVAELMSGMVSGPIRSSVQGI